MKAENNPSETERKKWYGVCYKSRSKREASRGCNIYVIYLPFFINPHGTFFFNCKRSPMHCVIIDKFWKLLKKKMFSQRSQTIFFLYKNSSTRRPNYFSLQHVHLYAVSRTLPNQSKLSFSYTTYALHLKRLIRKFRRVIC